MYWTLRLLHNFFLSLSRPDVKVSGRSYALHIISPSPPPISTHATNPTHANSFSLSLSLSLILIMIVFFLQFLYSSENYIKLSVIFLLPFNLYYWLWCIIFLYIYFSMSFFFFFFFTCIVIYFFFPRNFNPERANVSFSFAFYFILIFLLESIKLTYHIFFFRHNLRSFNICNILIFLPHFFFLMISFEGKVLNILTNLCVWYALEIPCKAILFSLSFPHSLSLSIQINL